MTTKPLLVTTQAALYAALAEGVTDLIVDAPDGAYLEIRDGLVRTWGSSRVEARGSSSVVAGRWVAVHLWSQRVTLTGDGHIIDMTALDLTDPATWCAYHGITVADGQARLYKAVNDDLATTYYRKTTYLIGGTVAATDWKPTAQCGNGLHFSPTPRQARSLAASPATRFLAVWVAVADLIPIGDDKCKAPACDVAYEVDIWGDRIEATA